MKNRTIIILIFLFLWLMINLTAVEARIFQGEENITFLSDSSSPHFAETPSDVVFTEGTTGHTIVWKPVDDDPDSYVIVFQNVDWRRETVLEEGFWNGSNISVLVDDLRCGHYLYNLTVYDKLNNSASDSVQVFVNTPLQRSSFPGIVVPIFFLLLLIVRKKS